MRGRRSLASSPPLRWRAGILAVFAITLTGLSARADEPTFTPVPAASTSTPAASPSAVPWLAQPSTAAVFTTSESRPSTSRMMWLVLPALALGGAALYVRLAKRKRSSPSVSRRLEVLDTARVGPKAHVVMISAGGRQLLIGVTEHSVQRLAWVAPERAPLVKAADAPAPERALVHDGGRPSPADGPFAHILKSFTQGKVTVNESSDAALTIAAETKDFVERRTASALDVAGADVRPANLVKVAATEVTDFEGQVSGLRKRRAGKHG